MKKAIPIITALLALASVPLGRDPAVSRGVEAGRVHQLPGESEQRPGADQHSALRDRGRRHPDPDNAELPRLGSEAEHAVQPLAG